MNEVIRFCFTSVWLRLLVLNGSAVVIGILTEALSARSSPDGPIVWRIALHSWELWTIGLVFVLACIHQAIGEHFLKKQQKSVDDKLDQILANTAPPPSLAQPAPIPAPPTQRPKCRILFSQIFMNTFASMHAPLKTALQALLQKTQLIGLQSFLSQPIVHRVNVKGGNMYVLRIGENRCLFTVGTDAEGDFILVNAFMNRGQIAG